MQIGGGILQRQQDHQASRQARERALETVIHQACDHYGLPKGDASERWGRHRRLCLRDPEGCLGDRHPKALVDEMLAEAALKLRLSRLTSRVRTRMAILAHKQAPPFEVFQKVDALVLLQRNLRLRTPVYRDTIQAAIDAVFAARRAS